MMAQVDAAFGGAQAQASRQLVDRPTNRLVDFGRDVERCQ
jgi:hypothetical protein